VPISDGLRPSARRDYAPPNWQSKLPHFAGSAVQVGALQPAITEWVVGATSGSWGLSPFASTRCEIHNDFPCQGPIPVVVGEVTQMRSFKPSLERLDTAGSFGSAGLGVPETPRREVIMRYPIGSLTSHSAPAMRREDELPGQCLSRGREARIERSDVPFATGSVDERRPRIWLVPQPSRARDSISQSSRQVCQEELIELAVGVV